MRDRPKPVRLPLDRIGPGISFLITLGYLVVLGALGGLYIAGKFAFLDDGVANAALIAWFAGLGGAMASLHAVYRDVAKWNPALNLVFLIRPLTSAVFGSVAYFIYVVLAQASINVGEVTEEPRPSTLSLIIGFALGYREEIFRRLIQRVIDLLATAGGADTEPPSAPRDYTCRLTKTQGVQLSWLPATDNVSVAGYNIYRDHRFLAAIRVAEERAAERPPDDQATGDPTTEPRARDDDEPPKRLSFYDTDYVTRSGYRLYSVAAVDGAGNESEPVGPLVVLTQPSEDESRRPG